MVRPRRALGPVPSQLLRRIVVLVTVPLLLAAGVAAGLSLSGQRSAPPVAAQPPTSSEPGNPKTPDQVLRAIADCRREVARSEVVLQAAAGGISNWRSYVQAQTDLTLGRSTKEKVAKVWRQALAAGPSDVAKFRNARTSHSQTSNVCDPQPVADNRQSEQLKTCRARLVMVRSALNSADLTMADWERQLLTAAAAEGGGPKNAEQVWLAAWRSAPKNLDQYASTIDGLAKTKSCPR